MIKKLKIGKGVLVEEHDDGYVEFECPFCGASTFIGFYDDSGGVAEDVHGCEHSYVVWEDVYFLEDVEEDLYDYWYLIKDKVLNLREGEVKVVYVKV